MSDSKHPPVLPWKDIIRKNPLTGHWLWSGHGEIEKLNKDERFEFACVERCMWIDAKIELVVNCIKAGHDMHTDEYGWYANCDDVIAKQIRQMEDNAAAWASWGKERRCEVSDKEKCKTMQVSLEEQNHALCEKIKELNTGALIVVLSTDGDIAWAGKGCNALLGCLAMTAYKAINEAQQNREGGAT